MFIDIHSHLDSCKDVSKIIENSKNKNVKIISCGADLKSNRANLKLVEKGVKVCLGIYPVDAEKLSEKEIDEEVKFIRKNKGKIVGIGEVGLDLKFGKDLEKQKNVLKKFILLAKELEIPIVIHSRKAEKEAIDFLAGLDYDKIIMHCFSGRMKFVEKILENNWYLSIPANIKNSEHFQKVVKKVPIENLFCETDSPYLHPDKKENNEPANVIESYKKIAEIKGISLKEVEKKIEENYKRIFKS